MLLVHLFALRVYVFVLFLFLLCQGLAAVCDCGILWTVLLTCFGFEMKLLENNVSQNFVNITEDILKELDEQKNTFKCHIK